jgi:hypothetical protein
LQDPVRTHDIHEARYAGVKVKFVCEMVRKEGKEGKGREGKGREGKGRKEARKEGKLKDGNTPRKGYSIAPYKCVPEGCDTMYVESRGRKDRVDAANHSSWRQFGLIFRANRVGRVE